MELRDRFGSFWGSEREKLGSWESEREYLSMHMIREIAYTLFTIQNCHGINKIYAVKMDQNEIQKIFLGGSMLRSRWKFSFNLAHTTPVTAHFQLFIFILSLS